MRLFFAGDFHSSLIENTFLGKSFSNYFSVNRHGLRCLNLEGPLTYIDNPINKDGQNLKISPSCCDFIKKGGFNLCNLANNHINDHGEVGIYDTIKVLEQHKMRYTGAGKNHDDASKVFIFEDQDTSLALISAAEGEFSNATSISAGCSNFDLIHVSKQILSVRKKTDFVIVLLHAGNEHLSIPRPNLRNAARFFVDLGASAVICHHSHTIGASECYKTGIIFYGLGNFFFPREGKYNQEWSTGLCLDVTLRKGENLKCDTLFHTFQSGVCELLEGNELDTEKNRFENLNHLIKSEDLYIKTWKKYCFKSQERILSNLFYPTSNRYLRYLIKNLGLNKFFLSKKYISRRYNIINCESHLDVLRENLRDSYLNTN